jgi:hypothetical protein
MQIHNMSRLLRATSGFATSGFATSGFATDIHDRGGKLEWFRYKAGIRTLKAYTN